MGVGRQPADRGPGRPRRGRHLFATLDSVTAAALDGVCPHGYAEDAELDGRVWEALHVSHALARSGEFDLVHNHLDWLPLAFSQHARAPMVTTIHGFSGAGILPAYTRSRSAFVAISDSDRHAGLNYAATIHHGIDLGALPYPPPAGEHLVTLGRIHPDKGTADAIEIARRAGRRLVICGIVHDEQYFAEAVGPYVDGEQVIFLGLGRAAAPGRGPRRRGGPAAPDPLRRAVRLVRRRGHGVRHPGRRLPARLDGRGRGRGRDRLPGRRCRVCRRRRRGGRGRLDRGAVHARAVARFGADRMVEDYLRVYETLLRPASSSPSGA